MLTTWKDLTSEIEKALDKNNLKGKPKELYQPISYTLQMGGKRIRPTLVLMAAELFNKKIEEVMHLALAVEIFHNFTVVHDDIMDEAPLRRGKETVYKKWGRDIAILSGDVMMIKAYEFLAKEKGENLAELIPLFNQTAIAVCEGQQLDMNFEQGENPTLTEYLKMIELKTAVLLAASLKMGAIGAGASKKEAQLLYEFGLNIGIAFQIQDDYLDAYANPDHFGKQVGGDILNNKKTYLLLKAMEMANQKEIKSINEIIALPRADETKISRMIELYNQLQVPAITKTSMEVYFNQAMNAIDQVQQPKESKQALIDLAKMLLKREN